MDCQQCQFWKGPFGVSPDYPKASTQFLQSTVATEGPELGFCRAKQWVILKKVQQLTMYWQNYGHAGKDIGHPHPTAIALNCLQWNLRLESWSSSGNKYQSILFNNLPFACEIGVLGGVSALSSIASDRESSKLFSSASRITLSTQKSIYSNISLRLWITRSSNSSMNGRI